MQVWKSSLTQLSAVTSSNVVQCSQKLGKPFKISLYTEIPDSKPLNCCCGDRQLLFITVFHSLLEYHKPILYLTSIHTFLFTFLSFICHIIMQVKIVLFNSLEVLFLFQLSLASLSNLLAPQSLIFLDKFIGYCHAYVVFPFYLFKSFLITIVKGTLLRVH